MHGGDRTMYLSLPKLSSISDSVPNVISLKYFIRSNSPKLTVQMQHLGFLSKGNYEGEEAE